MIKSTQESLLNSLNISNGSEIGFLLGAGCSINSGCMAASKLVLEFKKRIFCSKHGISLDSNVFIDDIRMKEIMDEYFKNDNYRNPYSYYFEKCFPDALDRNQFIKNQFQDKMPSYGYLCFAAYLLNKGIKNVLTTNFDLLIEKSIRKLDENYDIAVISENENPILSSRLNLIKLHGDYNYDSLKNTDNELDSLNQELSNKILDFEMKKIIVLGYSGYDKSVMSFLNQYLDRHKNTAIMWCGIEDECSNEIVKNLLSKNEHSSYIHINGFDSLFERYYKTFGPANEIIDNLYSDNGANNHFDLFCTNQPEYIQLNAFPLIGKAYVYKTIKEIDESILNTFSFYSKFHGITYIIASRYLIDKLSYKYNISICSIEDEKISINLKCKLLKELIKWSMANNNKKIFRDNVYLDNNEKIKEGLKITVDLFNDNICLILNPNYFSLEENNEYLKSIINKKKSNLYTRNNYLMLNLLILKVFDNSFSFGDDYIHVNFSINKLDRNNFSNGYDCISEPIMYGNIMKSVNQIKILTTNGPRETIYSPDEIHIGILCLEEDKDKLKDFLYEVEYGTNRNGNDVIPKYAGFETIFKKKILFDFNALPALRLKHLANIDINQIVELYGRGLDKMYKEKQVDLALIYISDKMAWIRNNEELDFHNIIKVRSSNRFKTQFLEERTIDSSDNRCKILLNFAIGIYTKTIGMPWYPLNYSKNTLFLGLSFGRDARGITVGCSQMFDGAGRGMQLIVSQISEKKTRKNQYLNENEAFELGKKIRSTYYKTSKIEELKRIVIHRSDPFRKEEIDGFKKAFEGIQDFVLLQIVEDTSLNAYPFGRSGCNGFPVKRGTVLKSSNDTAYIWTDGSVVDIDINNGLTYRNSKRGMGKPLKIKKFHGNISINDVATDLMFLTKMDFNSSDVLYSKLPVTIKYSRVVCELIKQQNFDDDLISFEYVM